MGLLGNTATASDYDDGGKDHLWTNADNWTADVPNDSSTDAQFTNSGTICEITSSMSAQCRGFYVGCYGAANEVYMTGGTLSCQWPNIGRVNQNEAANAYLRMTGGTLTSSRRSS